MAEGLRVGVLASGRGSNLQAILDAQSAGQLAGAHVVVVASNRADAFALERARQSGVAAVVMERRGFASRRAQQTAMADVLRDHGVGLVALAGFDQVLSAGFLDAFEGQIMNIHPSLLPAFGGGLHAQAEAWRHGVKVTGCTVHFVTAAVDAGPIILQAAVPVMEDDTPDTLAARILTQEHRIFPLAIRLFAEGRLRIEQGRVHISDWEGRVSY